MSDSGGTLAEGQQIFRESAVNPRKKPCSAIVLRVEVRILGPVEIIANGRPVELRPGNEQALVALLALHAGEPLSVDRIVDAIWGESPPSSAREMIRIYVGRLRRQLGEQAIPRRGGGYALELTQEAVDRFQFEQLRRHGTRSLEQGDAPTAARLLTEALAIWRGAPLGGIERAAFVDEEVRRLEELRLATIEERFEAELTLGRPAELIPELDWLVTEHPYRERLRGQLMQALYQSGRQTEALERYRAGRSLLVDELGIEPGVELQRLEQAILRQDETLDLAQRPSRAEPARPIRQRRRWLILAPVMLAIAAAIAVLTWPGGNAAPLRTLPSNSLGEIDARTGTILARAPIGGVPGPIASDRTNVWVADGEHRVLYELDPVTLRTRHTIGLAQPAYSLVVGAGSVWVGNGFDGTLTRIDSSASASPPFKPEPRSTGRLALAFDAAALWVGSQDGALTRLDPRDERLIVRIGGVADPEAVAAAPNAVWVAQATRTALARIDPATNRLTHSLPIGGFASSIAIGAGAVWATSPADGHLWRIDPQHNDVTASIAIPSQPSRVVIAGGYVWVASGSTGTLFRINPQTDRIAQTINLRRPLGDLAATGDRLWVSVR